MTNREDCVKWLTDNGYDAIFMEDLDLPGMLHEFSKTTIGHFPEPVQPRGTTAWYFEKDAKASWVFSGTLAPAEEESQKRTRAKDLIWSEDAGCWLKPIPAEEEKQKGSL